jgi:dihydroorotase
VLDKRDLRSRSKNSPFDEARLQGRVLKTIVGGTIVFDEEQDASASAPAQGGAGRAARHA